ncbi:MAG: hypothetical protein HY458_01075 [Parcubacteria group bacterium]|nr:hypothetical protein [Parcubacteria group bacterium]
MSIGIIGVGTVGRALADYFQGEGMTPLLYDPPKRMGSLEELNKADVMFVCVPTPSTKEGKVDLSFVEEACRNIGGQKVVVLKSTMLPGTTARLQEAYPHHTFLYNPEFLQESRALEDMLHPLRQIVGYTEKSQGAAQQILEMLPRAPLARIIKAEEAEMVKYFGNTFLALKVIFANQLSDLCEQLGIDYEAVRECAGADPRIGQSHLDVRHSGYRGYGGKCFPKDMRAFIHFAREKGLELRLHEAGESLNAELMKLQGIEDPEKLSTREE